MSNLLRMVLNVLATIELGALAVIVVYALMAVIVFVSGWLFGVGQ